MTRVQSVSPPSRNNRLSSFLISHTHPKVAEVVVHQSEGSYQYQRYTYRVLQTIQIKRILLCVWAEPAVLGSTKTVLKFKYEI